MLKSKILKILLQTNKGICITGIMVKHGGLPVSGARSQRFWPLPDIRA